jgi:hypothetical protein
MYVVVNQEVVGLAPEIECKLISVKYIYLTCSITVQ